MAKSRRGVLKQSLFVSTCRIKAIPKAPVPVHLKKHSEPIEENTTESTMINYGGGGQFKLSSFDPVMLRPPCLSTLSSPEKYSAFSPHGIYVPSRPPAYCSLTTTTVTTSVCSSSTPCLYQYPSSLCNGLSRQTQPTRSSSTMGGSLKQGCFSDSTCASLISRYVQTVDAPVSQSVQTIDFPMYPSVLRRTFPSLNLFRRILPCVNRFRPTPTCLSASPCRRIFPFHTSACRRCS